MKVKSKFLKLFSCGLITTPFFTFSITSCSNKQEDPMVNVLKNEAIEQFTNLVKIPHVSDDYGDWTRTNNMKIYLKNLLLTDKFNLHTWHSQDDGLTYAGNAYFDIPASSDGANIPTIILQAHMDMVFATIDSSITPDNLKIELVNDVVNNKNVIHSKDYKTNIGSDDGIGLAMILAIAAHRDEFTNGKIRCLLTSNEEVSWNGAEYVPADDNENWFRENPNDKNSQIIDYLINVDDENIEELSIASCGGFTTFITCDLDSITPTTNDVYYSLVLDKFKGGHSADMTKNQTNAIKYLAEVAKGIEEKYSDSFKLYDLSSPTEFSNQIAISATAKFAISSDKTTELQNYAKEKIAELKEKYSDEVDATIEIKKETSVPAKVISIKQSQDLLSFLNYIPCGLFVPQSVKGEFTTANIGPISFDLNDTNKFVLETFPRGYNKQLLEIIHDDIHSLSTTYLSNYNQVCIDSIYFDPWLPNEDNPMQKLIIEAYHAAGINPNKIYCPGALETSWWIKKQPKINMAVTGPTVINGHKVEEMVYLDTLNQLTTILLYSLKNLKK